MLNDPAVEQLPGNLAIGALRLLFHVRGQGIEPWIMAVRHPHGLATGGTARCDPAVTAEPFSYRMDHVTGCAAPSGLAARTPEH